jgi:hypothetical protein
MKKKIFVMGNVYDLSTQSVNMIENEVQADLDKVFNAGGVKFKLREVSRVLRKVDEIRKGYEMVPVKQPMYKLQLIGEL